MKKFRITVLVCFVAAICLAFGGCFFFGAPGGEGGDNPPPEQTAVGYYFDSSGDEQGDGSEEKPFNSLSKIADLKLSGGENILLKAGSVFKGSLQLIDIYGSEEKPVTFTAYGDTAKDGLPKINGDNLSGSGVVYIENCDYVTVSNLEIYDEAQEEGDRRGVLVNAKGNGSGDVVTYTGITLEKLYIHDIRGITDRANSGMSAESKKTGGIHVWSEDGYGRFDYLTIKDCRIDNVDNVGLATWRQPSTNSGKVSPYSADFDKYSYSNVLITGNEISHIGKNAIFARNLKGGFIEHNTMYETATTCVSGNTICTTYVYGTVVQFNEGYFNRASPRASDGKLQDGCMLDADLQSRDTIWQYNYSHDNSFGLFLNCTSYTAGSIEDKAIVRYNLSVHDYGRMGIVYINYVSAGIDIYNNTFVVSAETEPTILKSNSNRKYSFRNNIIYNLSSSAKFAIADTSGVEMGGNLVYDASKAGIAGSSTFDALNQNGLASDPLFVKNYADSLARAGRDYAENFKLSSSSPALSAGIEIAARPSDFFGNPYKKSIGFYCGA